VDAACSIDRDVVAANGRAYVEKHHNWNELLAPLDTVLNSLGVSSSKQAQSILECL
jgi:hypothetical protein